MSNLFTVTSTTPGGGGGGGGVTFEAIADLTIRDLTVTALG